jgi:hypothetical protein
LLLSEKPDRQERESRMRAITVIGTARRGSGASRV